MAKTLTIEFTDEQWTLLLEYFQLMNTKNEEIQKWIEDSLHKLNKQELDQRAYIEKLKRDQREIKDPEETKLLTQSLVDNEVILDDGKKTTALDFLREIEWD